MDVQVQAFLTAQAPLQALLQAHIDAAYAGGTQVPRSIVFAYNAGTERNLELLRG
jgi:hypothetical protein